MVKACGAAGPGPSNARSLPGVKAKGRMLVLSKTLKGSAHHHKTMTTIISSEDFNDAQRSIYGRRRIIDTLYQKDPDEYKDLVATDIKSIFLQGGHVGCCIEDYTILIERGELVQNFWEHRTRTPSFFDYKIWKSYENPNFRNGVPVGAIDYGNDSIAGALETNLGRKPKVAIDKNGVEKLYFVNEFEQSCTCDSWNQLNKHKEEFEKEFAEHSSIVFTPMCKHLRWLNAAIKLQSLAFIAKGETGSYNPHRCVYYFDSKHKVLRYRVTHDGVKANAQWLPVSGWKEKFVYDAGGMPTGECWQTLESALSCDPPYKLVPYSPTVGSMLGRTGSK